MVFQKLYLVSGSWSGTLYLSGRPRGGDWLPDEISGWRRTGIDTVVSLLTSEEERGLDLTSEASEARKHGMSFLSCPIADRQTPTSPSTVPDLLDTIQLDLRTGKAVLVHCRQGIGRAGLIAASLLIQNGVKPEWAIRQLTAARGVSIPETPDQEKWIYQFAANMK